MRKAAWIAGGTAGIAAIAAAAWLLRDRNAEQPDYDVLVDDGLFELRGYPALIAAETGQRGPREAAIARGRRTLDTYIAGRDRSGPRIARTAPLIVDRSNASQWRVRAIMPARWTHATLPAPGGGVAIVDLPARRIAVRRLSGNPGEAETTEAEAGLAAWLSAQGLSAAGPAEQAIYNAPSIPGPLRRTEVWLPV